MADQTVTLYPGDSLTVNVSAGQPDETAPDAPTDPAAATDTPADPAAAAPDAAPTDPAAVPDPIAAPAVVVQTDSAPGGVGAG
jgi:hypothetical protein